MPSPEFLKCKILVKAKKDPKKISEKLLDCVNYIEAKTFPKEGFDHVEHKYYQMSSFHEGKAFEFFESEENSKKFVKYNCRNISRIYPDWNHIGSGNLKPIPAWNVGCQLGLLIYTYFFTGNFEADLYFKKYFVKNSYITKDSRVLRRIYLCDR